MAFDLFISHASEDKEALVRPLATQLRDIGYRVWYDEFELRPGDSLIERIDYGLSNSRAGVFVLSAAFFSKKWPKRELVGITTRQLHEGAILLPIWYGVTVAEVLAVSPPLADVVALRSTDGLGAIVTGIQRAIAPTQREASAATIEEAEEQLRRGTTMQAYWLAGRALDLRLFSLYEANRSRMRSTALEHLTEEPWFHADSPHAAMHQLDQAGLFNWTDTDGQMASNLIKQHLGRSTTLTFAVPAEPDESEIREFVGQVRRFLRANPLR